MSASLMNSNLSLDKIYPVGSIYMNINSTNPADLFGGIWEQIKERFMLGCGDTHIAGSIGGEFNHTLTVDEMPKHRHSAIIGGGTSSQYGFSIVTNSRTDTSENWAIKDTGGNSPHNITPPILRSISGKEQHNRFKGVAS